MKVTTIHTQVIDLFDIPSITLKSEAAKEFCKANGYIYEIIDPELIDHASLIGLMESGLVKLTERTKVKLQTYEREQ